MIWDVISDEDMFKFLSRDIQNNILQLFLNNLDGFYKTERTKTASLVNMNKKYILLILNHLKEHHASQPIKKIKIYNDDENDYNGIANSSANSSANINAVPISSRKEVITFEEIQNEKRSQFEKDLQMRQQEFTNSITVPVPPKPQFADNFTDAPINEMEKAIKEMAEQRSYDIEMISKTFEKEGDAEKWLQSKNTNAKNTPDQFTNQKKNVSWGNVTFNESELGSDNNQIESHFKQQNTVAIDPGFVDASETNLFLKLKRIDSPIPVIKEAFQDTFKESKPETRISKLENDFLSLSKKIDHIIELLEQTKQSN